MSGFIGLIELDATGLLCPLPVLKLQKKIKSIKEKERIKLITDDPAAVVDVNRRLFIDFILAFRNLSKPRFAWLKFFLF